MPIEEIVYVEGRFMSIHTAMIRRFFAKTKYGSKMRTCRQLFVSGPQLAVNQAFSRTLCVKINNQMAAKIWLFAKMSKYRYLHQGPRYWWCGPERLCSLTHFKINPCASL